MLTPELQNRLKQTNATITHAILHHINQQLTTPTTTITIQEGPNNHNQPPINFNITIKTPTTTHHPYLTIDPQNNTITLQTPNQKTTQELTNPNSTQTILNQLQTLQTPTHLKIIGDVHEKIHQYLQITQNTTHTIQIGDLAINPQKIQLINQLNPNNHKILPGNHDNYTQNQKRQYQHQTPHYLKDYGTHHIPQIGNIYYIRGAHSIDQHQRTQNQNWWPNEQLTYQQATKALKHYTQQNPKPQIIITHDAPQTIIPHITTHYNGKKIQPSLTQQLLQQILQTHPPKTWIFGHHHKPLNKTINNTHYICLPELHHITITPNPNNPQNPYTISQIQPPPQ